MQLEGPVIFTQINISKNGQIISVNRGLIEFHDYIKFSDSVAFQGIIDPVNLGKYTNIVFHDNTIINMSNNIYKMQSSLHSTHYHPCYFQFISDRGNLDDEFINGSPLNYSIVINNDTSANYLE